MQFTIITTDEFEKKLESLTKKNKPLLKRIAKAILRLEENPYAGKPLSYTLAGYWSFHIGKYRIIYEIDENSKEVILRSIGHRKHAYF